MRLQKVHKFVVHESFKYFGEGKQHRYRSVIIGAFSVFAFEVRLITALLKTLGNIYRAKLQTNVKKEGTITSVVF